MILLININNERNDIIIFRLPLSLISLTVLVISVLIIIIIIRVGHSSWDSPAGVILMGGYDSQRTTEKILQDGTSTASFDLRYHTQ